MSVTYEPIASTALSVSSSAITFSSIPGTYTDLKVVVVGRDNSTAADDWTFRTRVNGNSGTNYSITRLRGNGSTASSDRVSNQTLWNWGFLLAGTSTFAPSLLVLDFFSYAGSTNKVVLMTGHTDRNGTGNIYKNVGLWRSSSAITEISLLTESGNWAAGTTATLYGIVRA